MYFLSSRIRDRWWTRWILWSKRKRELCFFKAGSPFESLRKNNSLFIDRSEVILYNKRNDVGKKRGVKI